MEVIIFLRSEKFRAWPRFLKLWRIETSASLRLILELRLCVYGLSMLRSLIRASAEIFEAAAWRLIDYWSFIRCSVECDVGACDSFSRVRLRFKQGEWFILLTSNSNLFDLACFYCFRDLGFDLIFIDVDFVTWYSRHWFLTWSFWFVKLVRASSLETDITLFLLW